MKEVMTDKNNSFEIHNEQIPTPYELKLELPITLKQCLFVNKTREQIIDILEHRDQRHLLIVGPCSVHDVHAALEYAKKLKQLANEISNTFLVVMRVYFEKPRSSVGWKGLLYDPHLDGTHDIAQGLKLTRSLLLDLAEAEIPAAAEFLDPASSSYFGDLISWACIGARTSESQTHRQIASGLAMPVAFKNSTAGKIEVAINGILCASVSHKFIGMNEQGKISIIKTAGNPHCHMTLRGGEDSPNYDPNSISRALKMLHKHNLIPRILIDCSHDNSNRNYEKQSSVFQSIIHQIMEGEKNIRGMIIESNLFAGSQGIPSDLSQLRYAVSLTDACLDWESTERLILWGYEALTSENKRQKSEVHAKAFSLK
jgi:3-deoxy-7-phosphoheptulonate synthase